MSERLLVAARERYLLILGGLLARRWIAVAFSVLVVALTAGL
jgi:hypothetical protein